MYLNIKRLYLCYSNIINSSGITVVYYVYDAYGNITKTEVTSGYGYIANINSYTYRGYRYDSEINMYYLNSRYYNPEIGRFINADDIFGTKTDILTTNMYTYSLNNPIMLSDPSGSWPKLSTIFTVIAAGTVFSSASLASVVIPAFIAVSSYFIGQSVSLIEQASTKPNCPKPDGSYPRDFNDTTQSPGEGWTWRGEEGLMEGEGEGAWWNPDTEEGYHPDFNHAGNVPRHWDYSRRNHNGKWRIWENGDSEYIPPKK